MKTIRKRRYEPFKFSSVTQRQKEAIAKIDEQISYINGFVKRKIPMCTHTEAARKLMERAAHQLNAAVLFYWYEKPNKGEMLIAQHEAAELEDEESA